MPKTSRIQSMTGFARAGGEDGARTWNWEAKSVNGKGLELRFRLPPGSDTLEARARTLAAEHFKRGNISIALTVKRGSTRGQYRINEDLLSRLLETVERYESGHIGFGRPGIDVLLSVKGVVEPLEEEEELDDDARAARDVAMIADLGNAFAALAAMRAVEGERLNTVLGGHLDEIERLCTAADEIAETQPVAIRARLTEQLTEILSGMAIINEERLVQEAALLASRADVREEIDRLRAHLQQARDLLQGGGVVGRKLDFLCQEFTREANTLCSKAAEMQLTRIGIDLKTVIEQFREQVQNIE
jgi:uncharacterized protein (TIGR00255 family)